MRNEKDKLMAGTPKSKSEGRMASWRVCPSWASVLSTLALPLMACGSAPIPTTSLAGVESAEVAKYTKACDGGEALACYKLACLFDRGTGVTKDEARAALLFEKACDGGEAQGCYNLGVDLAQGVGVPKDEARAAIFYTKACDGGELLGCYNFGLQLTQGIGVPKDEARAAIFYTKACDGGELLSCYALALQLAQGVGVDKDEARASILFKRACDGGVAQACSIGVTSPQVSSYAEARAKFQTHLVRKTPAPQRYRPISPPPGTREISYSSGGLELKAWINSAPTTKGQRLSAVLFLHGGFAFAEDDWEMTKPYRDAGFVVLAPMLRGENGLPGNYTMFFDEINDVLAAADALAALPYVRADHLYIAGHSVGGTLTMLAAMTSGRFRAAASFSGSPDQVSWSAKQPELVPFDPSDAAEFQIRSPIVYATSFQCPARLYHGSAERYFAGPTAKLAELAQAAKLDVRAVPVAGDHMSHVAEAMKQSIEFFREKE